MSSWIWDLLDRFFFGSAGASGGEPRPLVRMLSYPYAVARDVTRGQINLRATGLVFTSLLALVPLLALSFAMLKGFGVHHDLRPIVYQFFSPVGDSAGELTERVIHFADRVSSRIVGVVGFALLAWTLVGTIKKVEDSFNYLWRVPHARSLARRVMEYLALIIVGPILLVGFIGLTRAALQSEPLQLAAGVPLMRRLLHLALDIAPYVMATGLFTALYIITPNTHVRLRPALVGAAAAGVLWAAAGKLFTMLVVYSTRLEIVYAGFAVVVAVFMWTYFGWLILLAGAQLSFYVQNPSYLRLGLAELQLSGAELEQLALKLMLLVGRAAAGRDREWTVDALAYQLGLPGVAVERMATGLQSAGLLHVTDADALQLGRDPAHIALAEILDAARSQRSGYPPPARRRLAPIERLIARLDQARRTACANRTLRDLLEEQDAPLRAPAKSSLEAAPAQRP